MCLTCKRLRSIPNMSRYIKFGGSVLAVSKIQAQLTRLLVTSAALHMHTESVFTCGQSGLLRTCQHQPVMSNDWLLDKDTSWMNSFVMLSRCKMWAHWIADWMTTWPHVNTHFICICRAPDVTSNHTDLLKLLSGNGSKPVHTESKFDNRNS